MITILDGLLPAWRIYAAGLAIVAALGAATFIYFHIYDSGKTAATATIERANNAATDKANAGGDDAGKAYDACIAAGGHWDRSNLVCDGGAHH